MTFRIYCKGTGETCRHKPVSWLIKEQLIVFGNDPHFKQENFQNCHMFEICEAEPDDEGTIKVKSTWDERTGFLEVISKFLAILIKNIKRDLTFFIATNLVFFFI